MNRKEKRSLFFPFVATIPPFQGNSLRRKAYSPPSFPLVAAPKPSGGCWRIGAPAKAADTLYAFANHASPLYNWREEHNPKDVTQMYVGDMPHNWASAEFIRLVSHLLQLDRGTELHLLEGLPEEWVRKGMSTSLNGMATPFGPLNLSLKVGRFGRRATLKVSALNDNCTRLIVHLGNWAKTPDGTQVIILDPERENKVKIKLNPSLR